MDKEGIRHKAKGARPKVKDEVVSYNFPAASGINRHFSGLPGLVPICSNHIIFAHDLCHSQIEYLRNSINFNRKDRAKRYLKSSIFNRQYSIWFRFIRVRYKSDEPMTNDQ